MKLIPVPFFTPIVDTEASRNERLAFLGRFSENIWNVGSQRVCKITYVSQDYKQVNVKDLEEKKRSFVKTLSKIILLVFLFPFFLGVRCLYKTLNSFFIEKQTSLKEQKIDSALSIPVPLIPVRSLENEKMELGDDFDASREKKEPMPLVLKKIGKKFNADESYTQDLLVQAEELYLNHKYAEALDLYVSFLISLENQPDKRKIEVLDKGFDCLKKLGTRIQNKTPKAFRDLYTEYKEHYQEKDPQVVKHKLERLSKRSLAINPDALKEIFLHEFAEGLIESHESILIKNESSSEESLYPYSVSSSPGRPHLSFDDSLMEDRHLITQLRVEQRGMEPVKVQLFILCDGHADVTGREGSQCAQFVIDNLPEQLKIELEAKDSLSDLNVWNALKLAPVKVHDLWKKKKVHSATTVSFALIFKDPYTQKDVAWVGNVGDGRTLLSRAGTALQLSTDARYRANEEENPNVYDKRFYPSLKRRNGTIINQRMGGLVQPLRLIGHQDLPGFSSRPDIQKIDSSLFNDALHVILLTDGVTDVIDSLRSVKILKGLTVDQMANRLVAQAICLKSEDNMTALVIELKS